MFPGLVLFYDPLTMMALAAIYVVGWLLLLVFASKLAPRFAKALAGRLSLYSAMLLTSLLIVVGGGLAIYGLWAAAASLGYVLPLGLMIVFLASTSLLSYLAAPWIINMSYGARPSPELQEIVNEVAMRAGMKPPKAVLVEGPPNAFAYGNPIAGRYVAVSRSLYEMLDRGELEAVIGHELGHHKHRDMIVILLLGLVPSILYYMGVTMIRLGLWSSYRSSSERREEGNGIYLAALGALGVLLSLVMQVAVLAFSRLREYYADAHGALVTTPRQMQRALAKIHLYYSSHTARREEAEKSSLKALFIYALTNTLANPLHDTWYWSGGLRRGGYSIDDIIEELKNQETDPIHEVLSDHPPIPKRLRFLDEIPLQQPTLT